MAGKYVVVFGTLVLGGFVAVACWLQGPLGSDSPAFRQEPVGPASAAAVGPIASDLGLHWIACPAGPGACNNIIISIEPLTSERLDHLNLHHPDFERWRGIVTISPCGRQILSSNYDPAHPERFAMWGDLFMFGDPELIARLITKRS